MMISQTDSLTTDVLIIGAGLAGLSTAISLPKHLQIIVLAKQSIYDCSSNYAQGGIAAVIDDDDSVADHVNDTMIAGDGLCDKSATTEILTQGNQAISWLVEHNVPFTSQDTAPNTTSNTYTKTTQVSTQNELDTLHLTREGGHGCRRVVHADDATGRHIMHTLHQHVDECENITILPYHEALNLVVEPVLPSSGTVEVDDKISGQKSCSGATVLDCKNKQVFTININAVVLASGGLGQLYNRATAPDVCVGDGIMMAWEAGCRLANMEFVQFHPTGLAIADSNFLISEAVRGEGGHLLCPVSGKRFMPQYDAREELAPRDIVARAIANEIEQNGLGYVYLDISHQPPEFIKAHFPDIYNHCLQLGIDISKDPIPVAPTAHYTCGGIMTTTNGQTDLPGLYAAGEVAHTGLHGANRLASNSLLECVVVGRAVAEHIPSYIRSSTNKKSNDISEYWLQPKLNHIHDPKANSLIVSVDFETTYKDDDLKHDVDLNTANSSVTQAATVPTKSDDLTSTASNKLMALKQLMTDNMGIRRSYKNLSSALKQVQEWQKNNNLEQLNSNTNATVYLNANQTCKNSASQNISFDIDNFKWQRLLKLASLLLHSAIAREESRGGHYRNDFPELSDTAAISVIVPSSYVSIIQASKRCHDDGLENNSESLADEIKTNSMTSKAQIKIAV